MHFWGRAGAGGAGGISELEKSQGLRLRANERENGPLAWPEAGEARKEGRNNEAKGPTRGPRVGF